MLFLGFLFNHFTVYLKSETFSSPIKGTTSLLIIGLCVGLIPDWGETSTNANVTTTAVMTLTTTLPATTAETVPYINSSLVLALQERVHDLFEFNIILLISYRVYIL